MTELIGYHMYVESLLTNDIIDKAVNLSQATTQHLPYHSLLHTIDHMQMYNTHIISCRNTIHLQQASNHLWKWIDWMYIAVNVHSVWTQIMRINSPLMQTVFITGTCPIFVKFFKGIPPSNPRWLWMAQYSLYIYV